MRFLLSFVALLLALPGFALAETPAESAYQRVMRTGILRCDYTVYDPYFTKDPNTGQLGGFSYETIEALGKILNIKIEWSYEYMMGTQVEALKSGKADALCVDGPWTRSAMPFLGYSHTVYYLPNYAFVAAGSPHEKARLADFNTPEITVAAMDGDATQDIAATFLPQAKLLNIPNSADPALMLENVAMGKAQAVMTDPIFVAHYNATHEKKLVEVMPRRVIATYPVLITALVGERDLLDMLNRAIDFAQDTGITRQILANYDPAGIRLIPAADRFARPESP